ncbi:hypothetical protein [Streptacidiphilus monticola]|uniref:Sensor histidine kinase n=1 Tax=Streptacidiphilus monticola TaxID=2161674 RepID=A0ABW1G8N4_9ACTN
MPAQPADLLAYGLLASFALGLLLVAATAAAQRIRAARARVRHAEAPTPVRFPHERDHGTRVGARS